MEKQNEYEPEKIIESPGVEQPKKEVSDLYREQREIGKEEQEVLLENEISARKKIEEKVSKIELTPEQDKEAKESVEQIKNLDESGKIRRLMQIAEEKGLVFAIKIAEGMDDPYVLDTLHDFLAKEGLYQKLSL